MSRSEARARRRAADAVERTQASARLGSTLRSVVLAPRDGFAATLRAAERRERAGIGLPEGISPYVLAACGGAGLMLLWLKVGALFGLRDVCTTRTIAYLVTGTVLGGILSIGAQSLWGAVGTRVLTKWESPATARGLRVVWGASAFPQVIALAVLLPFDLLIVGTDTFTTARLQDGVATAWAAVSIALGLAIAVWSAYLFVRGVGVASGGGTKNALVGTAVAFLCLVALVAAVWALGIAVGGARCPTLPA